MVMNLTNHVRSIIDVRGEILELEETVTESLSVFADEVTRVAREVGTEGKFEGQARVARVDPRSNRCRIRLVEYISGSVWPLA